MELTAVAVDSGLAPTEMAFIVADTDGGFGRSCVQEGAGLEFLVRTIAASAMVIPLGVDGLVAILASMVPDGIEPVLTRTAGLVSLLLVDANDEPAIVLLDARRLAGPSPS